MSAETQIKGQKNDTGKQKWYRMPLSVLKPLSDCYCVAGTKHPPFNCLLPFDDWNSRLYDAQMRHTEASQLDPLAINHEDGGVYHLAQVAFSALTRLDNALREQREQKGNLTAGLTSGKIDMSKIVLK